ncbi:MFS general substrate transporter [Hymenopellis radicata]|nr:MFS general substrate transporter [Hymenopellis radicata]
MSAPIDEKDDSDATVDEHVPVHDYSDFPDGGLRAWLVVTGAMCNTFTTFGYVNSWGVFQSYYQSDILKDTPPSNIAWIGSVQYSLVFLPGLFAGRLFDLGYFRPLLLGCSALLVIATFLVAECHEYWQFLLCQGFAVGLACGGIMNPTMAVIAHWFKRRRGLAMGLMAMGSSFGGTLIPIAARNLIPKVGADSPQSLPRRALQPPCLPLPAFSFYCASTFASFLGIYTVLTYIDVSAVSHGIDENFSFYLVSIANASSGLGRYCAGMLADRVGPMNVMIPFTTVAAVTTFAWPFAVNKGGLIAIALVYGYDTSFLIRLILVLILLFWKIRIGIVRVAAIQPVMEFGDASDVGRRVGMMMSILALGALAGPPISGAINTGTGGFEAVGYYAGSAVLVGVGLMVVSRYFVLKGLYGKF